MTESYPSFTPFLLANPLLRNAPNLFIERICRHAMATMHRRHRPVFERVAEQEAFALLISPTDLDLQFYLKIDADHPELRPARHTEEETVAAQISGPLPALLELLQGTSDGDALFFSRTLQIEGRTELVIALRNALDGESIDLRSAVSESFGVMGPAAKIALGLAEKVYRQLQHDMNRTADALTSPSAKRLLGLEKRTAEHAITLAGIDKTIQRRKRHSRPAPSGAAKDDFAMPTNL
ncbi:MAG: ubiquinone anaerobic biosynthesis accessory factor UbiT [Thalassospira sp.]|uniref:ubiquinone anaerobic biosynthesis accessory factor UbiT n=1 Tax=Thalassospira sp. TaxID=1912094 RepID=UPI003A8C3398